MSEEVNNSNSSSTAANVNQNCHSINLEGESNVLTPPTSESCDVDEKNEAPCTQQEAREASAEYVQTGSNDVTEGDVNLTSGSAENKDEAVGEEDKQTPDTDFADRDADKGVDLDTDNNDARKTAEPDSNNGVNTQPVACGSQVDDTVLNNENQGTASKDNAGALSAGDSIYHIKWIYFKQKLVPIITQNENGPCPLLAILNVLLLQARVKIPSKTEVVTANQLMTYLGDCVLENCPSGGDEGMAASARLNFEQNMHDAVAVMYKLQTGIDVNVRFTGIKDFEYTPECIIFDLLQICLCHGWMVDPQNEEEVKAVGTCSYNQLVEKIIIEKTSDVTETVRQALVAEQFLESSASQLTYHGLSELSCQLKEDELVVLFRNNHFITLYRHKNELFQLVTDQGLLHESNVVWETLSNVEGDCHFVDSEFHTYTKPEPVYNPVEGADTHLNTDEQIEQDYMVALSIQQEQQDQMSWAQIDPQQPIPQLSDLELARSLQEEERRAAVAEQERAQRQQVGAGSPRGIENSGQRHPQRVDSRESKKSDCCIL